MEIKAVDQSWNQFLGLKTVYNAAKVSLLFLEVDLSW